MTQTSLSQSPNDTTSSQDVIEIKTVTRSVGR
ncbi:TetR family transcriptional regulator, partial [Acinetobacter baumannii]